MTAPHFDKQSWYTSKRTFLKEGFFFIIFNYMYCVVMCTWAQVPTKARGVRCPEAVVTGSCKLSNTGAGNQTLALFKSSTHPWPTSHLSSPKVSFSIMNPINLVATQFQENLIVLVTILSDLRYWILCIIYVLQASFILGVNILEH